MAVTATKLAPNEPLVRGLPKRNEYSGGWESIGGGGSVFGDDPSLFTRYRVWLEFIGKVMGGVSMDPKLIEGWIRTKTGITDEEEIRTSMVRTLLEMGIELPENPTMEQLEKASESIAAVKNTNGFKRDPVRGLYIEGRQLKAAMKEAINIALAGERLGPTKKGAKNFLAERVFVVEDVLPLYKLEHDPETGEPVLSYRMERDGLDLIIGHVTGPSGPRSTLTYREYVLNPRVVVTFLSSQDLIEEDEWRIIWEQMEQNGIGSLRSQEHGKFLVRKFVRIAPRKTDAKFSIPTVNEEP